MSGNPGYDTHTDGSPGRPVTFLRIFVLLSGRRTRIPIHLWVPIMSRFALLLCGCLAAVLTIQSCKTTPSSVTRIEETSVTDLSGRWNDTDARLVAKAMVDQVLSQNWLNNFVGANDRKPVVIVGMVRNKTHEHIDPEVFTKEVERSFINAQTVRVVQGGEKRAEIRAERADQQEYASTSTMKKWGLEVGADYMMQGSINSIVDSNNKQKVVYYKVNLELTDIQTNEIVWIGDKEIKKLVDK